MFMTMRPSKMFLPPCNNVCALKRGEVNLFTTRWLDKRQKRFGSRKGFQKNSEHTKISQFV